MKIYVVYSRYFDGCDYWQTELSYFLHKDRAEYEVALLEENDPECDTEYGNSYYWRVEEVNEETL